VAKLEILEIQMQRNSDTTKKQTELRFLAWKCTFKSSYYVWSDYESVCTSYRMRSQLFQEKGFVYVNTPSLDLMLKVLVKCLKLLLYHLTEHQEPKMEK
jgi:hypothetical protein